jgi:hypothetical protein
MIEICNISYTTLFAIDTLSPLQKNYQTTHGIFNQKVDRDSIPDNVRCIKGKGDDDLSLCGAGFLFLGELGRQGSNLRPPAGGYDPDIKIIGFSYGHKKRLPVTEAFSKLRGQGSNLRPSGYEPDELPLLYRAI